MRLILSILMMAGLIMGGPMSKTHGIDSMRGVHIAQFTMPHPMIVSFNN